MNIMSKNVDDMELDEKNKELSLSPLLNGLSGLNFLNPIDVSSLTDNPSEFLQEISDAFDEYRRHGARSSKKVDKLHANLVKWLEKSCELSGEKNNWSFVMEKTLPSCNASGEKRCDITAMYNGKPSIVFPVKFIMSNYYQNKNNGWEVLTGECCHLKWANDDLRIVPVNIMFNQLPYLDKLSIIKKWEDITYSKTFKIIDTLKIKGVVTDTINYIIDVHQDSKIGEKYDKTPRMIGFNRDTPYRPYAAFAYLWKI
uniref:Uncharacterized protein n=1 Tax=viral metagenome TaxID=1070528 RepID=A0A6C0KI48_9ZZZZ